MKHHTITGGGGYGFTWSRRRPGGRRFCSSTAFAMLARWNRQLNSDLADRYRLVAMDLRGTAYRRSPATATLTPGCGLMTSTRSFRR
jgi:hypothetical protein